MAGLSTSAQQAAPYDGVPATDLGRDQEARRQECLRYRRSTGTVKFRYFSNIQEGL